MVALFILASFSAYSPSQCITYLPNFRLEILQTYFFIALACSEDNAKTPLTKFMEKESPQALPLPGW